MLMVFSLYMVFTFHENCIFTFIRDRVIASIEGYLHILLSQECGNYQSNHLEDIIFSMEMGPTIDMFNITTLNHLN